MVNIIAVINAIYNVLDGLGLILQIILFLL